MLSFLLKDRDLNEDLEVITGDSHEEIKTKCLTACNEHFVANGSIIGLENTNDYCTFFSFKEENGFEHKLKLKTILIR